MSKAFNKILARYPHGSGGNDPTLWELPDQGVYLTHSGSITFIRICSKEEFESNQQILLNQGWVLESK